MFSTIVDFKFLVSYLPPSEKNQYYILVSQIITLNLLTFPVFGIRKTRKIDRKKGVKKAVGDLVEWNRFFQKTTHLDFGS